MVDNSNTVSEIKKHLRGASMKSSLFKHKLWGMLFWSVLFFSCTTAKPIMEWKDPGYAGAAWTSVGVDPCQPERFFFALRSG